MEEEVPRYEKMKIKEKKIIASFHCEKSPLDNLNNLLIRDNRITKIPLYDSDWREKKEERISLSYFYCSNCIKWVMESGAGKASN